MQANGGSQVTAMSADGRFVAFRSVADNLVPGDTNGRIDVFVRDRQAGTTERVSLDVLPSASEPGGTSDVLRLAVSSDGRFVAFGMSGDGSDGVIYVRDRQTASTEVIQRDAYRLAMSADGRFIAYTDGNTSAANNLIVRDRQTDTNQIVSVSSSGEPANASVAEPAISANGRVVAFVTMADNLAPDDNNGTWDVFVHDRDTGLTERVTVDRGGGQDGGVRPTLSADGRFVSFSAGRLLAEDTNNVADVYVHDRQTDTTERVSVDSSGVQANNESDDGVISADGRRVAFWSRASNLVPGDTNSLRDVFLHDRQTRVTQRISVDSSGAQQVSFIGGSDGFIRTTSINGAGTVIAFETPWALDANDSNRILDVYARVLSDSSPPPPPPNTLFKYVALGDSYSSGEGVDPYLRDGYDPSSQTRPGNIDNRCHRSTRAYAEFVKRPADSSSLYAIASGGGDPGTGKRVNKYGSDQNVRNAEGVEWVFWACAGAVIRNVLRQSDGGEVQSQVGADEQFTQLDNPSVDSETDLVTITIGGNDVQFTSVLRTCATSACATEQYETQLNELVDSQRSRLAALYRSILARTSNQARVLVLSYPQIFPAAPSDQSCAELKPWRGEQDMLRRVGARLNNTIRDAASDAGVEFVPVATTFGGHEICTREPWINGYDTSLKKWLIGPDDESFHPTLKGQLNGYTVAINAALSG